MRIRIALVILKDNKILLLQHYKNGKKYWLLPGGGLQYGETIENCAIRELKEETNLDIKLNKLLLISESIPPDKHRHIVNLYFQAIIISGKLKLGAEKPLNDIRFFELSELNELIFYPNIKKELLHILHNIEAHIPYSVGNRWE